MRFVTLAQLTAYNSIDIRHTYEGVVSEYYNIVFGVWLSSYLCISHRPL